MIYKVYSVYDAQTKAYGHPMLQNTHGEAERTFKLQVNNKDSRYHQSPEDYDLFHIGEYDDNTGGIERLNAPQHIIKATALLN